MKTLFFFGLIGFSLFLCPALVVAAANPDIEIIRGRIVAELLEPEVNEPYIKELISSIRKDGTWPGIDYQDVSRTGFQHGRHLNNLVQMGRAYKKKGSSLKGKKDLKNAIYSALDYWLVKDFICENWWWNEIGTPNQMTMFLLIMDKDLTPTQIEKTSAISGRGNLNAWGARPSGDRIKIAGIQAKNELLRRDVSSFENTIKIIESEIKFSTGKRGMQADYSFHHRDDRVNNTLSYGLGYADSFAEWAAYTAGTRYRFPEQPIRMLVDYYLDGICKQMVYGKYSDPGVKNRDITRRNSGRSADVKTPERLLIAANYRKTELEEIIAIRLGKAQPTRSFDKFFWQTEYYTHQRLGYFTSVRMFSERNANMEEPYNGEGLMNHHRGDGTNYLSLSGDEYFNLSPVYDWQKIPGTTVLQKPELPSEKEIQKWGTMDFVGAVTDELGLYGAAAFDFVSPHDPLRARKTWFFFDDEYVCLGAGIRSETNHPVVTTMNQCRLKGDVTVTTKSGTQIASRGEHRSENTRMVYHDGVAYLFPEPVAVNLSNQPQSGSWFNVNRQSDSPKEKISMDVFKLWIDHGTRVKDGSYQYIVMPGTSKEKAEAALQNPKVEILANTPDMQAVRHKDLNVLQVVFHKNGVVRLSDGLQIGSDSPGIVMLRISGTDLRRISVADPSRKLGKMHITINRKIYASGDHHTAAWNEAKGVSEYSIDLPQGDYAGKSVTIF